LTPAPMSHCQCDCCRQACGSMATKTWDEWPLCCRKDYI